MENVYYSHMPAETGDFCCETNEAGQLISLRHRDDPHRMNWVEGKKPWGTIISPKGLEVRVERGLTGRGTLRERYTFRNATDFDFFLQKGSVGIYTTWNDNYQETQTCMTNRCHTHIWCGGHSAYVMALRMGGEGKHLGLVLTEGSLCAYSVERDPAQSSNDRGDFILHPSPVHLNPGESFTVEWELLWFDSREEFEALRLRYDSQIAVSAPEFTLFAGEKLRFAVDVPAGAPLQISSPEGCGNVTVSQSASQDGRDHYQVAADAAEGEHTFAIAYGGRKTWARFLVLPPIGQLAGARCRYIAEKQQYHNPESHLDGAYLIYDTEDQEIYYFHWDGDHNGGRERVGMGALMAFYLQSHQDDALWNSLQSYKTYVLRELIDPESGVAFNEAYRCQDHNRLYNYPLYAVFFMELYRLEKDSMDLTYMYRIMKSYYSQNGTQFYAICIPMEESIALLREAGMKEEADSLLRDYRAHGDVICERGTDYPPHEVNFEQSIVSPAANYLPELYHLTREKKYLEAAETQLKVLSLFDGRQPDYHLYQVAIRHWDGYWFGKRCCFGDTFPHYWSALSGMAYSRMAGTAYAEMAEPSLRGVLSLIRPDGSASCAYVYPFSVNGVKANYADPWANDQDWGLYFYLKYGRERNS